MAGGAGSTSRRTLAVRLAVLLPVVLAAARPRIYTADPDQPLMVLPAAAAAARGAEYEILLQKFLATFDPAGSLEGVELKTVRSVPATTGMKHLLQQQYGPGGLPIVGAYVKATVSSSGQLLHVVDNLVPSATAAAAAGRVSVAAAGGETARAAALAATLQYLGYHSSETRWWQSPTVKAVLLPSSDGTLLPGFEVQTWTHDSNELHYTYVTSEGQVLHSVSYSRSATAPSVAPWGKFRVFKVNPLAGKQVLVSGPKPGSTAPSQRGWLDQKAVEMQQAISGNNAIVYLDVNGDGMPDAEKGKKVVNGIFDAIAEPNSGNTNTTNNRAAAVQNLMYLVNTAHDILWRVGFVEAAGNFQSNNFKRFGAGGDPVHVEAQSGAMPNNAAMSTPTEDGQAPRMMVGTNIIPPVLVVTLAGTDYPVQAATFGPAISKVGVTAPMRVMEPVDGCAAAEPSSLTGAAALVHRGNCSFMTKVGNAQLAGAVAVIIINYPDTADFTPGADPSYQGPSITIPSVLVNYTNGSTLEAAAGQVVTMRTLVEGGWLDLAFDSDIIMHEYAHGLTDRIVGFMYLPPLAYAFAEGASDVFAFLVSGDDRIGRYMMSVELKPGSENIGIRRWRYKGYPITYAKAAGQEEHDAGEIYAAAMWRLKELYDAAGLKTTGGVHNDLLYDWVNGLFYTPQDPTFEQARDGLLAHLLYTNGTRRCLAWQAFAAFGIGDGALGIDAVDIRNQTSYITTITESFQLPEACQQPNGTDATGAATAAAAVAAAPLMRSIAPPNPNAHSTRQAPLSE